MYKGREFHQATGDYVATDIIAEQITFRGREVLRVFLDADTTAFQLEESIDGVNFKVNAAAPTTHSGTWRVIEITGYGDGNYPLGTVLRVVATGAISVDTMLVVQDW